MSDNLEFWNKLSKTDPKHTKGFKRAGGFTGTAIKPIYQLEKMTEVYGPIGRGWGMTEPTFQIVPGVNQEVLVYCTVGVWAENPDRPFYGVGGDKVVVYVKANEQYKRPERWENDDEAFKKAFTDAVGNAMKHLGMSADVHMGLFDDSKYVQEREREERAQEAPSEPVQPSSGPLKSSAQAKRDGDWEALTTEIDACSSIEELNLLVVSKPFQAAVKPIPLKWQEQLRDYVNQARAEFEKPSTPPKATDPFGLDRLELTQAQKIAGTP